MKHDFKALSEKVDQKNILLSLAMFYAVRLDREVLDFHEAMFDAHLEATDRFLAENGIDEMTISSDWSGTTNAIAFFVKRGWKLDGVVAVKSGTKSYKQGEDGNCIEVDDLCDALHFVRK